MAGNVSTVLSICLYCKTSSKSETEKEFHEIFDDVGLELQLPALVEKFFHYKLTSHIKQVLCEDCVNCLIELYDLEEHDKEENCDKLDQKDEIAAIVNDVSGRNEKKNSDRKENAEKLANLSIENKNENFQVIEDIQYDNDILQVKKKDSTNVFENAQNNNDDVVDPKKHIPQQQPKCLEIAIDLLVDGDLDADNQEIEYTKGIENCLYEDNIQQHEIDNRDEDDLKTNDDEAVELQADNNAAIADSPLNYNSNSENQEIEPNEVSGDVQYATPKFPVYNEDQECLITKDNLISRYGLADNGETVLEVKLKENFTNKDNFEGTEIPSEELDIVNEDQSDIPEEQIHNDIIDVVQSSERELIYTDQNDFVEEHVYDDDEESLLECQSQNSVGGLYYEIVLEDDDIDELVESVDEDVDVDDVDDVDFKVEELKSKGDINDIDKETHCIQENFDNLLEIDNDALSSIVQETEITQDDNEVVEEVMIENMNDETMSTEEEYIIEELTYFEKFDCVDLSSYLDNVLLTEFEKLDLKWSVECKLCLEKYETLQDLLNHSCINELFEREQQCCCSFKDCEEIVNDIKSLARHLIIQHYDNLKSLSIYSRCTDCEKNFSNFIKLNKHSCCRSIKRKSGSRKYCKTCCMDFASLKRFVFHMQFHLTKHRPNVCLLCGALFQNSNDFFEHTQYSHEPEIAMACVKCDRFFKNINNYESHMVLHDELKYTFSCSYCPKKYTKKSGLNLHMDVYHNHKKKPLECEYCDKELATNSSYRNHMKSHIPEAQVPAFVCSECGLISDNANFMKDHLETDKESPCYSASLIEEVLSAGFTCENCSIDFRSKAHLQKHRLSATHSNKVFYCYVCRKAFKSFRHMRNHSINHKDYEQCQDMFPIARFYMCDIKDCQESYPLWSSLYYHKKRPHKDTNSKGVATELECQFCQQIFLSKMSLAVHIARSHNKTLIRCSHCSKSYKNEKLYKSHIAKFHTAVKCSICYTNFKNRRNLESHKILVHSNEKRYFCRHCKKGYFYKSEMEYHEKNVHTDILYKCEICNFITSYPKSLEIHLDKHNNKLNFQCTVCSKSFGRKQLLTVHMKRHQDTKEYVCCEYYELGCNESFVTYNLMKTHIQKKHENPKDDNENVTVKRRRSSRKCPDIIEMEDSTTATLLEDKTKRCKSTSRTAGEEDVESETNSIELKLVNDISEELQSDNEFTIQYEEDTQNSCE